METFATSYLAQFHAMEGLEPPRGVMLPLFCSLQSREQIDEWSRSIAAKFDQVEVLINFIATADNAIVDTAATSTATTPGVPSHDNSSTRKYAAWVPTCLSRRPILSAYDEIVGISRVRSARSSVPHACNAVSELPSST
jgi:hypothetical protein